MLHCFMADPFTISFLMKMITDRVDMMLTRGLTLERVTAVSYTHLTLPTI